MPTQALFDKHPLFPKDIGAAQLQQISYAKLLANDKTEAKALLSACQQWGFFLLDFRGCPEGEAYIQQAAKLFEINEEVHSMGVEELMKYYYNTPHSLFGYVLEVSTLVILNDLSPFQTTLLHFIYTARSFSSTEERTPVDTSIS